MNCGVYLVQTYNIFVTSVQCSTQYVWYRRDYRIIIRIYFVLVHYRPYVYIPVAFFVLSLCLYLWRINVVINTGLHRVTFMFFLSETSQLDVIAPTVDWDVTKMKWPTFFLSCCLLLAVIFIVTVIMMSSQTRMINRSSASEAFGCTFCALYSSVPVGCTTKLSWSRFNFPSWFVVYFSFRMWAHLQSSRIFSTVKSG